MPEINSDYTLGLKREVATALRACFGDSYPDENLRNKIKVEWEFPLAEAAYPCIYITFTEGPLKRMGIGHIEQEEFDIIHHWSFTGVLNFNVLGQTMHDRDMASAGLIHVFALGRDNPAFSDFFDEIHDNDYLQLHFMSDYITPGGTMRMDAPWGANDQYLYAKQYSVDLFGEFATEPETGNFVKISRVDLYPYRLGEQPPPW